MTSPHRIELSGKIGLREAAGLAAALGDALDRHPAVTVVTGALTEVDLSILQLLVAARHSAARAGKSLTLAGDPGEPMRDALVRLGFLGPGGVARSPQEQFWVEAS